MTTEERIAAIEARLEAATADTGDDVRQQLNRIDLLTHALDDLRWLLTEWREMREEIWRLKAINDILLTENIKLDQIKEIIRDKDDNN